MCFVTHSIACLITNLSLTLSPDNFLGLLKKTLAPNFVKSFLILSESVETIILSKILDLIASFIGYEIIGFKKNF